MTPPILRTVEDAARYLGVPYSKLDYHIKQGDIPYAKIRNWRYIRTEVLLPWVKQLEAETQADERGAALR